jgi:hypothetical protein
MAERANGIPSLEIGAAATVVSLAIVNVLSTYRETAPSLKELRHSPPGDFTTKQLLQDANIFGGIAVLLIGGGASLLSRSWLPLVLSSAGLLLVSCYYQSVYNSPDPATVTGTDNTREP